MARREFYIWLISVAALLAPGVSAADPGEGSEQSGSPLAELGDFERRAVRRVLRDREWRVEPNPEDKTVGEVHVVSLPVFGRGDPEFARWFNRFHTTTRSFVIRREVLLEPGERWNQEDVDETERNLRDPVRTSFAVAIPVRTPDSDTVDLLVVTRDIWSLRASTNFEFQNGALSQLTVELSENNLLGRHKSVAAGFRMDLGSFGFGPRYRDPNVFGSRWQFFSNVDALFDRRTGGFEGSRSETTIRYPLWNLDRTWGGDLTVSHADRVVRRFEGVELLQFEAPESSELDSVPYEFRIRRLRFESRVRYAVGESVEHRFWLGYRLSLQEPEFPTGFPEDEALRAEFRRRVMPPSERNSGPLIGYRAFVPEWETYRNVSTYGLSEERSVGPYVRAEVAPTLPAFGSLGGFVRSSGRTGWLFDIGGEGFVWAETGVSLRYWSGRVFDRNAHGFVRLVTPPPGRVARLVARGRVDLFAADTQNRLLSAGGQTGLRGFEIGARQGTKRLLVNVEWRSLPIAVDSFEFGGLIFWDVGDAADAFSSLALRHDVGAGLRLVIPQFNTIPLRFDWAFPLSPGGDTLPGRFSLGLDQAF